MKNKVLILLTDFVTTALPKLGSTKQTNISCLQRFMKTAKDKHGLEPSPNGPLVPGSIPNKRGFCHADAMLEFGNTSLQHTEQFGAASSTEMFCCCRLLLFGLATD